MAVNWDDYKPYFSKSEFACKHTGRCEMDKSFMDTLLAIRKEYDKAMVITSGYRDSSHPIERAKPAPGEHAMGLAADVAVQGEDALRLIDIARKHGIVRLGVQQKGTGRFIHLGGLEDTGYLELLMKTLLFVGLMAMPGVGISDNDTVQVPMPKAIHEKCMAQGCYVMTAEELQTLIHQAMSMCQKGTGV